MTRGLARISSCALRDLLAEIEHRDPFADAHDNLHVVLDQQDRQVQVATQPGDELGHLAGLAGIHASGRLVQQQQLRVRRQRSRPLEPALIAIRQVLGQLLLCGAPEADQLQQLLGAPAR